MDMIVALGLLAVVLWVSRLFSAKPKTKNPVLFDPGFDPARLRLWLTARGAPGETPFERWVNEGRYPEYATEPNPDVQLIPPPDFDQYHAAIDAVAEEGARWVDTLGALPSAEPADTVPGVVVPFGKNEPQTLDGYIGQRHLVELLKVKIRALSMDRRVIDHKIFTGVPGMGKTLIAKIITNELNIRAESLGLKPVQFFESFAVDLDSVSAFDAVVKQIEAAGGGVWFIDETHVLDEELATKLYPLMTDGRYSYHGSTTTTFVPDVVVLGATTDYAELHGALKRRFGEPLRMRPATPQDLKQIVMNRDFAITEDAADAIVAKTKFSGAPWEAIEIFGEAEDFARADSRAAITPSDVEQVFETYEIDELGLRWIDREVIRALFQRPNYRGKTKEFVCYGASEADVCAVAGLSVADYHDTVKGRLLARGLIEVRRGYGQALTERAVNIYRNAFDGA